MSYLTKKETKKLLKEASKFLRDAMRYEVNEQIDNNPNLTSLEFDMNIKIGVGNPPPMDMPSAKYQTAQKCYWICYNIAGKYYCFPYCW